jgi:xanthine dehydrogenase accessory factor
LSRIDGPAGVQIGARGPAEIALSVAAGMVKAFETAAA